MDSNKIVVTYHGSRSTPNPSVKKTGVSGYIGGGQVNYGQTLMSDGDGRSREEQIRSQVDPRMLPYINMNTGDVDVVGALKSGISAGVVGEVVDRDTVNKIANPSQSDIEQMFEDGKKNGSVDKNAVLTGYDKDEFSLNYSVPAPEMTAEEAWADLQNKNPELKDATFKSFDKNTGMVYYEPPSVALSPSAVGMNRNSGSKLSPAAISLNRNTPLSASAAGMNRNVKPDEYVPWITSEHQSSFESIKDWFTTPHQGVVPAALEWFKTKHESPTQVATEQMENANRELQTINAALQKSNNNVGTKIVGSTAIGLTTLANGLVLGFPGMVQRVVENPSTIITDLGAGLHGVTTTVTGLAKGDYRKSAIGGDVSQLVQDVGIAYLMGELGAGLGGTALRGAQFASIVPRPDYVPLRSLSSEAATRRLPFTNKDLASMRKNGATDTVILQKLRDVEDGLARGEKSVTVDIGGKKYKVNNVEYQKSVGKPGGTLSFFSSTPDITQLSGGRSVPLFKDFYAEAKAAIEPLKSSYSGGKGSHPGIAQILVKDDPATLAEIAGKRPFFPVKKGGFQAEPEKLMVSLNDLEGMGYRLEPIPGKAGRGITYDASVGPVQIRRFTLSKVTDNSTGLKNVSKGGTGDSGTVAIGDLHGTSNYRAVFEDINKASDKPILSGNPDKPSTWNWSGQKQNIVIVGDSIDRGTSYNLWRNTFNRIHDQAKSTGGSVERLLGNHEIAYLADDAISGIKYTDALRKKIKPGIVEDVLSGRAKASYSDGDTLFTHAGVSTKVFPEFKGVSNPDLIARDLNNDLVKAVKTKDFSGRMFAKGRVETGTGHSYKTPQENQGGTFWLRPQEASIADLDLGFKQVVGHNPGWDVRRIWGDNFIEVDVSRRTGGSGAYYDTPFMKTESVPIGTKNLGGTVPNINRKTQAVLMAKAMRDTVADFVVGWDGRVKAWEAIKDNEVAMRATQKSLKNQIKDRKAAKDSVGVKYLKKQLKELTSPTSGDYLYGGISFWRDLVMGRQNSVKALGGLSKASRPMLNTAMGYINSTRNQISGLSNLDVQSLFGSSKSEVSDSLSTSGLSGYSDDALRAALQPKLESLSSLIDDGLERSVAPYIDNDVLADRYYKAYQDNMRVYSASGDVPYSGYIPRPVVDEYSDYDIVDPRVGELRTGGGGSYVPAQGSGRYTPPPGRSIIQAGPEYVPPPGYGSVRPPGMGTVVPPPEEDKNNPRLPKPSREGEASRRNIIPEGSIAWAQGMVWKYIPKPWREVKPRTLNSAPEGAKNPTGTRPMSTIQVVGDEDAEVPSVAVDMGATDILITDNAKKIAFTGNGERTNVGKRIASPTVGMSVGEVKMDNEITPEEEQQVAEEDYAYGDISPAEPEVTEEPVQEEEIPAEEETLAAEEVPIESTRSYKAGVFVGNALRSVGGAAKAAGVQALKAGHAIQTIMTKDGPVQVETAPEAIGQEDEELADLFEVPQEEDNDMYTEDLFEPPGEEEIGDLVGEEDMSDLFSMNEPIQAPPGRRIIKVVRRPSGRSTPPAGMGGYNG